MERGTRRHFLHAGLALAGSGLLVGCGIGPHAARPASLRRIGFLADAPDDAQIGQLLGGFGELGYVEGANFALERRFARGDLGRFPALIAELEALEVECIVCGGIAACVAAKEANPAAPLVSWQVVNDVIDAGLVQSIARPEGNMTGTAGVSGLQFHDKILELLHDAVPGVGRIGVLVYALTPAVDVVLGGLQAAAGRLGLQLDVAMVPDAPGIESAIPTLSRAGAGALLVVIGFLFLTSAVRPRIAELALAHRLPTVSPDSQFPKAGGLLAYSPDRLEIARRVATYVDKILAGAKPRDLPMERPTKYDLVLNLNTARALGLSIPQSVMMQATEIIQ